MRVAKTSREIIDMRTTLEERLDTATYLAGLKSEPEPLIYVPNTGNAGDSLIGHATFQLFDQLDLDYRSLINFENTDPSNRVVICAGGGNLVPLYNATERVLRWASGRARKIIVLPHTIRGNEDLLAELGPEVDLICREDDSLQHVRDCISSAQCFIANDMALSLDAQELVSREPQRQSPIWLYARKSIAKVFRPSVAKTAPCPWKLRRGKRMMATRHAELGPGSESGGELYAFRNDVEKTSMKLPENNIDVAQVFSHGTKNPLVCHYGSYHMMRYLNTFDVINTNRLHVSIAGALLGKQVRLWPNSYGKNQAVYDYSMLKQYPNVEWASGNQEPGQRAAS